MTNKLTKILIFAKGHHNIAGAQLYLKQIAEIFKDGNYELNIALKKSDGLRVFNEIAEICIIKLWEFDWRHYTFFQSFRKGIRLIKDVKPSLIIFNSSEDQILPLIWASVFAGKQKILMIVHWAQTSKILPLLSRKKGLPFPIPSRYSIKTRMIRALAYLKLDKIIFVNKVTNIAYQKLYKIKADKCVTIYNGIDPKKYQLNGVTRERLHELNIKNDDLLILATGNLTLVKGHKYLIEAINLLNKKHKKIKCIIAGEGELRQNMQVQINSLGLNNIIFLLGYRNDIPELLNISDIYCMPSLNEALSFSLLEAMAAGIPSVASRVGGIPEVIEDGVNGFLVDSTEPDKLAEALEKLILNQSLRNELGSKGQKRVIDQFSIKEMLLKTKQTLMEEIKAN